VLLCSSSLPVSLLIPALRGLSQNTYNTYKFVGILLFLLFGPLIGLLFTAFVQ
jgi:hypothetical protein